MIQIDVPIFANHFIKTAFFPDFWVKTLAAKSKIIPIFNEPTQIRFQVFNQNFRVVGNLKPRNRFEIGSLKIGIIFDLAFLLKNWEKKLFY